MGKEIEYKFAATPTLQNALRDAFGGDWTHLSMETTYYDTPALALSARHVTLRKRLENGVSICTVKTNADHGRGEWECACEKIEEAIPRLIALGAPLPLAEWVQPELAAICMARFTRLSRILSIEGGTVELALDSGLLLGGGKQAPLCEIEAELKSGTEASLDAFATELSRRFTLSILPTSKFRRALALAKGDSLNAAE